MATIRIPSSLSAEEINAVIQATQPGDSIEFEPGIYMLDRVIDLPYDRYIYISGCTFHRMPDYTGPYLSLRPEPKQPWYVCLRRYLAWKLLHRNLTPGASIISSNIFYE